VVIIPNKKTTEFTNRSMDMLERESRIRKEIEDGSTLGKATKLLEWEKK